MPSRPLLPSRHSALFLTASLLAVWSVSAHATWVDPRPTPDSSGALATTYAYNAAGYQYEVTDNVDTTTRTEYDALGRPTAVIENYDDGVAGGSSGEVDVDRVTRYAYNAAGQIVEQTADLPSGSDDQTTQYIYSEELASPTSGGPVPSFGQLRAVVYPDALEDGETRAGAISKLNSATAGDFVETTYYADGALRTRTDQRGVKLTYHYNDDRTRKAQVASSFDADTDDSVQSMTYTYDDLQRLLAVSSHSSAQTAPTSTDVVNQVTHEYTGMGQLSKQRQDLDSIVDASGGIPTQDLVYDYDTTAPGNAFTKALRQKSVTYPNGRKLHTLYDAIPAPGSTYSSGWGGAGIDDALSRPNGLANDDGTGSAGDTLVAYAHSGTGTTVIKDLPRILTRLDHTYEAPNEAAPGDYLPGIDRFGRLERLRWDRIDSTDGEALDGAYGTTAGPLFDVRHTYDAASNREQADRKVYPGLKETYTHDELDRLASISRDGEMGDHREALKIVASDAAQHDLFSGSVSLDRGVAVIGAQGDDDGASSAGSAYVFESSGNGWSQTAKLTASDAAASDYFGSSVSVSNGVALIGAYANDDNGTSSGSAYIFENSGSGWTQTAKLTASDAAAGDSFGIYVSIHDGVAMIGAFGDDDNGTSSGSVYVFEDTGSGWTQTAKLTASDAAANDNFGHSVSVGDGVAVIGARGDDDGGSGSGSAYVFEDSGSGWGQTAKLTASDAAAGDSFGSRVAVDGGLVLVGASKNDDDGTDSGSAYIFEDTGSGWTQAAKLTASDADAGDAFGQSVAISNGVAVVGAYLDEGGGSAYVFEDPGTGWTQTAKLTGRDVSGSAYFGENITISQGVVIVGSVGDDTGGSLAGAAYLYSDVTGSKLNQTWTLDALGNWDTNVRNGTTQNRNHDDANQIEDLDGDTTPVGHDAAGNMTRVAQMTNNQVIGYLNCTYDAWNRLVEIRNDDSTPLVINEMEYDGLGRRIRKAVLNSGDADFTYKYYYHGQQLVEVHNGSDLVIKQYVWGLDYIDELIEVAINQDPIDTTEQDCERPFYVVHNAQYNVLGLVQPTYSNAANRTVAGQYMVERYEYSPYGERIVYSNGWLPTDYDGDGVVDGDDYGVALNNSGTSYPHLDLDGDGTVGSAETTAVAVEWFVTQSLSSDPLVNSPATGTHRSTYTYGGGAGIPLNTLGHQGLYHDEATGLVYNRARYVNPPLGRFLKRDTYHKRGANHSNIVGYQDGMSLYQYVASMPLNAMDPSGLRIVVIEIRVETANRPFTAHKFGSTIRNNLKVMLDGINATLTTDRLALKMTNITGAPASLGWQVQQGEDPEAGRPCRYIGYIKWSTSTPPSTLKTGEIAGSTASNTTTIYNKFFEGGTKHSSLTSKVDMSVVWTNVFAHEQFFHGMVGGSDNNKKYTPPDIRNNAISNHISGIQPLNDLANDIKVKADVE